MLGLYFFLGKSTFTLLAGPKKPEALPPRSQILPPDLIFVQLDPVETSVKKQRVLIQTSEVKRAKHVTKYLTDFDATRGIQLEKEGYLMTRMLHSLI